MRTGIGRRSVRLPLACALSSLLLVGIVPLGVAVAGPDRSETLDAVPLEHLSDVLERLDAALAALEAPAAERLEEGLAQIIELLEGLMEDLTRSREDEEDDVSVRTRLVRLDLMLHRLVHVLEAVAESAQASPARPQAREALDGLRAWMDGYVDGATTGMAPREAVRFERAAHEMVRALAQRLADMAHRAQRPERDRPPLARLVERLEELLYRLDGFIMHRPPEPPRE